jgi:CobQ-like glutamine amidotransferase family enzyme
VRIRVGHLYPDYLNIYADRGNIAVFAERARARGHELHVRAIGLHDPVPADEIDLFYIGGGQDREQALVAPDLVSKAEALRAAVEGDAVFLAVCGGYQLLGRFYRDVAGGEQPGIGLLPLETIAGERRMIGDVLLQCAWAGQTLAGFENHAGQTFLDEGAEPLGRVVAGFGNDGSSGDEGCRYRRVYGTYLHGPLLPRNPWFADRLLAEALAHASGTDEVVELPPLEDRLEHEAHVVSAARARSRGGRR